MATFLVLGSLGAFVAVAVCGVMTIVRQRDLGRRRVWTARMLGSLALGLGCVAPFVLEPALGIPMVATTSFLLTLCGLLVVGALVKRSRATA